jgi:hypothetical protein
MSGSRVDLPRARQSLDGLSVRDAFGQRLFDLTWMDAHGRWRLRHDMRDCWGHRSLGSSGSAGLAESSRADIPYCPAGHCSVSGAMKICGPGATSGT